MAKMIRMTIDGRDISFICSSRDTRSGFAHDATIFIDGRDCGKATCHYINRTWERYPCESVCLSVVSGLIESRKARLKDNYKDANGLTRLCGMKHKAALAAVIDSDDWLALLKGIRDNLRTNMY